MTRRSWLAALLKAPLLALPFTIPWLAAKASRPPGRVHFTAPADGILYAEVDFVTVNGKLRFLTLPIKRGDVVEIGEGIPHAIQFRKENLL